MFSTAQEILIKEIGNLLSSLNKCYHYHGLLLKLNNVGRFEVLVLFISQIHERFLVVNSLTIN